MLLTIVGGPGTGKSTLARSYCHSTVDIDCLPRDEVLLEELLNEAAAMDNYFHVNRFWARVISDNSVLLVGKVLLIHSVEQLPRDEHFLVLGDLGMSPEQYALMKNEPGMRGYLIRLNGISEGSLRGNRVHLLMFRLIMGGYVDGSLNDHATRNLVKRDKSFQVYELDDGLCEFYRQRSQPFKGRYIQSPFYVSTALGRYIPIPLVFMASDGETHTSKCIIRSKYIKCGGGAIYRRTDGIPYMHGLYGNCRCSTILQAPVNVSQEQLALIEKGRFKYPKSDCSANRLSTVYHGLPTLYPDGMLIPACTVSMETFPIREWIHLGSMYLTLYRLFSGVPDDCILIIGQFLSSGSTIKRVYMHRLRGQSLRLKHGSAWTG